MKVVFSVEADDDLENIGDYIAIDSPRRAISFVRELRTAAITIGEYPDAFPLIPHYEHYGIRRRPYRNYLIFYATDHDRIFIVHILNGAQDYEAILFPES